MRPPTCHTTGGMCAVYCCACRHLLELQAQHPPQQQQLVLQAPRPRAKAVDQQLSQGCPYGPDALLNQVWGQHGFTLHRVRCVREAVLVSVVP